MEWSPPGIAPPFRFQPVELALVVDAIESPLWRVQELEKNLIDIHQK
jgi:hypothetical protein